MKTVAAMLVIVLTGCATTLDPNFAVQMESYRLTITSQQNVEIAKARAEEARYNALATIADRADAQSKQMAILALALSGRSEAAARPVEVQLPRIPETAEDRALKWASVLVPSVANIALAGFSYSLGKRQSDNQAATTQSSYAALVAMKPPAVDFTKLPPTTNTVTMTTTNIHNDTEVGNRDGFVVVGGQAPTNPTQDNRVTTPAPVVITPVVVVPPVITGP
jgi:hypothetical protein